jgi:hypothetical protein
MTAVERHPRKKIGKLHQARAVIIADLIVIWSSYILGIAAFVAGLRRL